MRHRAAPVHLVGGLQDDIAFQVNQTVTIVQPDADQPISCVGKIIILQIHDELTFIIPKDRLSEAVAFIRKCMEEQPFPEFDLPLIAEASAGPNFGEMEELVLTKKLLDAHADMKSLEIRIEEDN